MRAREIMKTVVRIILLPAVGVAYLCLKVGILPTLLVLLFSTAFIYLGIRRFYRWLLTCRFSASTSSSSA
jgi:hypothetical protein